MMMSNAEQFEWHAHVSALIKKTPNLNVSASGRETGVLSKESLYAFTYDRSSARDQSLDISIGMPFRTSSYASGDLFGIFAMNEPEGYLRLYIEDAMSRAGIPNKLLFLALSQGLQIGRVSYQHPDLNIDPPEYETLESLLKEKDASYFDKLLAKFALRSSLSGAQPKIIVPTENHDNRWKKTSLFTPSVIVKEAGHEYPGLSLNEYFCMSVARNAGLNAPQFWLSEDASRFIIERFDRDRNQDAVGFEDMTVLAGVTAARKYQGSYEGVMKITQTYCQARAALQSMFERIALSALLKDGDAHLKNFGLVYKNPNSEISPSPIFDVVCTAIYPELDRGLALKMNKSRVFPTPDDLALFAEKFGIERDLSMDMIGRIEDSIDTTLEELSDDNRYVNDPNKTISKIEKTLRSNGRNSI